MCNLYSLTRNQEAIRRLFNLARDLTGNLPPLPAIFPDTLAPVVCADKSGLREMLMMRWGFPPPPQGNAPVTNVRNTASPFWRAWLKPEFRCLVPATSFCEWTDSKPKVPHWFAVNDNEPRPVFAFAGIWRPWTGERKKETAEHLLFSFLTTAPNSLVAPVHAKAMPVILTPDQWETWLSAPAKEALKLQQPAPDGLLRIAATGERKDETGG